MVTWFNEDRTIKRQADVRSTEPGFVTTITRRFPEALTRSRFVPDFVRQSAYRNVIQGVNDDWKIVLPNKTGPSGYITSTPDSRVFVHESHPKQSQIALDIYVHGKLASVVGPFPQYDGEDVHLGSEGGGAPLPTVVAGKARARKAANSRSGRVVVMVSGRGGRPCVA